MRYNETVEAKFIKRPNRFIAFCNIDGKEEKVHVPNTGRCKELFKEGVKVILSKADENSKRKTRYSLVSVYKEDRLINIDSQSPNAIVEEGLKEGKILNNYNFTKIQREKIYDKSRFDIYYERESNGEIKKGFVEVKGVTLEKDNKCLFPDAPTERGLKHILELIKAKKDGFEANILFLIQMSDIDEFMPNYEMQPEFASALALCEKEGVKILSYSCDVKDNEVVVSSPVKIVDLSRFLEK